MDDFISVIRPNMELYIYGNSPECSEPFPYFFTESSNVWTVIDGKLFNTKELARSNFPNEQRIWNDAQLLIRLYQKAPTTFLKNVNGAFAGVIFNIQNQEIVGFKDPIGHKSLYYSKTADLFAFSSELKALADLGADIIPVSPGTIISSKGQTSSYYNYSELPYKPKFDESNINQMATTLRTLVEEAVVNNLSPNRTISALLSGGLDSTIVTSIAKRHIPDLHVYSVGLDKSEDIKYARKFTQKNKLRHTVLTVTLEDMLKVLPKVIYALETFDAALIRSAVPMYLVSKVIKAEENPDLLLTGEGGDELFGGYKYLVGKMDSQDFIKEQLALLEVEYKTGLQRVEQIPSQFSIDACAPLFDKKIVEFSFRIPPNMKIRRVGGKIIKKWILRKAFENSLPKEIVWRPKQKFSEGAGTQFLLRDYFEDLIPDREFATERHLSPEITLRSKEELYYWRIFNKHFHPTRVTLSEIGLTSVFSV
ncbi:MAG: asparagine synthase-related protein [Promethearchaeota archaeon]